MCFLLKRNFGQCLTVFVDLQSGVPEVAGDFDVGVFADENFRFVTEHGDRSEDADLNCCLRFVAELLNATC